MSEEQRDEYDASAIRILKDEEIMGKNPWIEAETLALRYRKDMKFVQRGLKACRLAGVGEDYFVNRYLKNDKSIPMNFLVDVQSRQIQGFAGLDPPF